MKSASLSHIGVATQSVAQTLVAVARAAKRPNARHPGGGRGRCGIGRNRFVIVPSGPGLRRGDGLFSYATAIALLALPASLALAQSSPGDAAFRAVFGGSGSGRITLDGRTVKFGRPRLVPLPDGRFALVSAGEIEGAAHVESGQIAVHYLKSDGKNYTVVRKWWNAGGGTSFGTAPAFSISTKFGPNPVIYTEGGGTWQGYTCSSGALIELTPAGPVEIATFPTHYDNGGTVEDERRATSISGTLGTIQPRKSFTITYRGSRNFAETYVLRGGKYRLSGDGESRMETC